MKKIFLSILVASINYGFSQDANNDYMTTSMVQLKQTAPEFSFTTRDGKTVNLSNYKGKVILINFFATWCGPCMQEMPLIQSDIWNKLKDNPDFVLLSLGRDHSQEEINKFIDQKKFTFPIYADKGKVIYSLYAKQYIPRNYLIDKKGEVIYATTGFTKEEFEDLKITIDKLLKK
ncbi:TlpA disulfide reductase family protein [Flavobacterium alvei]|jgi:peroxiredoxin|uniref:TlpA family protein disulfide reductase n=1 Tax=Flavobacterium alvei TaxID=2080416 RepID=UPI0026EA5163|nr:TlpA disulfide reductase family protein [Flavobacterium alvei]